MIKIYTKEDCIQCLATKSFLDKGGVEYEVIDLDNEPDRVEEVKEMGYKSIPVVVDGGEHWSGFRPDKLGGLRGN